MFLFLLFSLIYSEEYGFNNIILKMDEIQTIDANNKKLILFLPKLRSNELTISMNSTSPITMSNFIEDVIQVSNAIITLKLQIDKEILINYWLIPISLCPLNSFVYDVEHIMNLRAEINDNTGSSLDPICIFSQITYDVMKTNLSLLNHAATFFDITMTQKMCEGVFSCTYISQSPFFIQIAVNQLKNWDFSLSSNVLNLKQDDSTSNNNKNYHCHFKPIIYWAGMAGIPSVFPGMIKSVQCINKYEEYLPIAQACLLTSLLSTVVVLILFIWKVTCKRESQKRNVNPPDTEYLIQEGVEYQ